MEQQGPPAERLALYQAALGGASAARARLEAPEVKERLEANRSKLLLMNASTGAPGGGGAQPAAAPQQAAPPATAAAGEAAPAPAAGSLHRNPVFGEVSSGRV